MLKLRRSICWLFLFSFLAGTEALVVQAQVAIASRPSAQMGSPGFGTESGDMRDAALVVGNALPFGPTDGILRYDGLGNFIDNMVPAASQGIGLPCCMAFGPDENLYVSGSFTHAVFRFNGVTGEFIDTFVSPGSGGLGIALMLVFRDGYLYVGDTAAGAVRRYDAKTGAFVDDFIPENSQGMGENLGDMQHVVFGPDGNVYIAAEIQKRILRYDGQTGAYLGDLVPSSEGFSPSGLTFGPDGMLYAGSYATSEVRRYDIHTGSYQVFIASGGRLVAPVGFAFGPDGNFYTSSVGTKEILRYNPNGSFLDAFVPSGRGGLAGPRLITWKVKATVCHASGGTHHAQSKSLRIGYLSAADHLRHGDTLGPCE